MIDKSLVKRRFKKSLVTYEDNAVVQKQMAKKLIDLLPMNSFDNVLEIGCSTGVLTNMLAENLNCGKITVNDIVAESKKYIDNILFDYTFISGDIETIQIKNKYDLIISNACLQWCNDIKGIINKLYNSLNNGGIIAVSIFGDSNLKELRNTFDIKEKAYSMKELKNFLKIYPNTNITEDTIELNFKNLREILQHLKLTGANAVTEYTLTKTALKNYEEQYDNNYSKDGHVILTYNPVYIIIGK